MARSLNGVPVSWLHCTILCVYLTLISLNLEAVAECGIPNEKLKILQDLEVKTTFYMLSGPLENLKHEITAKGPIDKGGIHREGFFEWTLFWNWQLYDDKQIEPRTISVDHTEMLTLPCWKPSHDPSSDSQRAWARYISNVINHEVGHLKLFREGKAKADLLAEDLRKKSAITPKEANNLFVKILKSLQQQDTSYDLETDHGHTQGASLKILNFLPDSF